MSAEDMLTQGYTRATYGDRIVVDYDDPAQVPSTTEEAADFLLELAMRRDRTCTDAPALLEFGVGTGRIALPLAGRGCTVAGIDSSEGMLARCREKDPDARLRLVLGDMAATRLERATFDVVYTVYNTLYYVAGQNEQVETFANASWHLKAGGFFVVEAFAPDLEGFVRDQQVRVYDMQADLVDVDLVVHDPIQQLLVTQNLILRPNGIEFRPSKRRYVWPGEMDLMARLAGLRLAGRYADWDRSAFHGPTGTHVSVYQQVDAR